MGKLRVKWKEFWRLEVLELVGGKYLSWVRVLRKRKKKKGLASVEREVGESAGVEGRWVLELLEC